MWADSTAADFTSTGPDQYLIRASGGVGIGTTSPEGPLHVLDISAGEITANPNAALIVEGSWINILTDAASENGILFGNNNDAEMSGVVFNAAAVTNGLQFRTGGNAARMCIDSNGNVGIGTNSPGFQLELSTNSAAKPTSNTWTISSDQRLKKNIQPIEHSLDRLLALRGVTYQWIDPASQGGMDGTYTGMIAQDVEQVFPEWVREDAKGYKTLTVIGFEGLTVEALRELREEKDEQINALRSQHAQQSEALRSEHAQQVDELRSEHARQIDALRFEHAEQLAVMKVEYAARNAELRARLEQLEEMMLKRVPNWHGE